MGFFSFITQDTGLSIPALPSRQKTFPVYMKDDRGNKWYEENYLGYGVFGGEDYYDQLVKMNREKFPGEPDQSKGHSLRDLYFSVIIPLKDRKAFNLTLKWPSLSEDPDHVWTGEEPESCPHQGFFY